MTKLKDLKGLEIYNTIQASKELEELEIKGFLQGEQRGKTMDVTLKTMFESLKKQYRDWVKAYNSKQISEMKKSVADVRNVAGCIFLKLLEGGEER